MKSNPCCLIVNPRTPKFQCCLWAARLGPVDKKIKPWTQRKLDRVLCNIEIWGVGFYLVDVCGVWFFCPSTVVIMLTITEASLSGLPPNWDLYAHEVWIFMAWDGWPYPMCTLARTGFQSRACHWDQSFPRSRRSARARTFGSAPGLLKLWVYIYIYIYIYTHVLCVWYSDCSLLVELPIKMVASPRLWFMLKFLV